MAERIKKFFQKKKVDTKFKLAGPGHKLNEATANARPEGKNIYKAPKRSNLSDEAKRAAEAALARLDSKKNDTAFNTSLAAIQAQVRRELEAEKKAEAAAAANESGSERTRIVENEMSPSLAVDKVYFKCPMIGNEILPKEEWKIKIKEFLYEQLADERGLTACLMIHSLNSNREKVAACVETLCKYLENIINNPEEEKFQRIRMSNRIFCDKVQPMEGSSELLFAAGFENKKLMIDGKEEDFLVYEKENSGGEEALRLLCDALRSAEPISLELDRNLQVLSPSQAMKRVELPPVFFTMSPEEIKREQQLRNEAMEKSMQLRTKAMREKEELKEMRKYRFALIRIRFPDGLFLQGTFAVYEKLTSVFDFVRENLEHEGVPFILSTPSGQRFTDEDFEKTLVDLRLPPATVLTFEWDPDVIDDLGAAGSTYLKPEVTILIRSL